MYFLKKYHPGLESEFLEKGRELGENFGRILLAADLRANTPGVLLAFKAGILVSKATVVDLGYLPLGYFGKIVREEKAPGIHLSADPYPKEFLGIKVLSLERSAKRSFKEGIFSVNMAEKAVALYSEILPEPNGGKLILDGCAGIGGAVLERALRLKGFDVTAINTALGAFTTRNPEPMYSNLEVLAKIRSALGGIAVGFDSSGSKLGIIDQRGRFWSASRLLLLLSSQLDRPVLLAGWEAPYAEETGVKINRVEPSEEKGSRFAMEKRYRRFIIGGTYGIIFPEWSPLPDALYSFGEIFKVLEEYGRPLSTMWNELPEFYDDAVILPTDDPEAVVNRLEEKLKGWERAGEDLFRKESSYIWVQKLRKAARIYYCSQSRKRFKELHAFISAFKELNF